jgi:hypothetical protein
MSIESKIENYKESILNLVMRNSSQVLDPILHFTTEEISDMIENKEMINVDKLLKSINIGLDDLM